MRLKDIAAMDPIQQAMMDRYARIQFSQFGEDLIIQSMLDTFRIPRRGGFYVDVGAHHPYYLSNTALLRQSGWSGINIDANPKNITVFDTARPDDINVVALISDEPGEAEFAVFELSAISSADPTTVKRYTSDGRSNIDHILKVPTSRLEDLLAAHVPPGRRIDLMNVDVEGFDLRVLRSNDWDRFAPFFLLVEDPSAPVGSRRSSAISEYLVPLGYRLVSQAFVTSIYVRDQRR